MASKISRYGNGTFCRQMRLECFERDSDLKDKNVAV